VFLGNFYGKTLPWAAQVGLLNAPDNIYVDEVSGWGIIIRADGGSG